MWRGGPCFDYLKNNNINEYFFASKSGEWSDMVQTACVCNQKS